MKVKISNELTEFELDNAARKPNMVKRTVDAAKTIGAGAIGAGAAVIGAAQNIKPRVDIRSI